MQSADYRYGGRPDRYAEVPYSSQQESYNRPVGPDPYAYEGPPSRNKRPDPYNQQRSVDPYDRMQPKDPYPVRAQRSSTREDPYNRQSRADPYDVTQQQPSPERRSRIDAYPRDDSFDGRDAPASFSSPGDYRRRPDQRSAGDMVQKSGQLQSYPKMEPMAYIKGPSVTHDLDHLATFTVNKKQNLFRPEDGIRRLRDMEATSGVWAMRVQLKIDRQEIVVIEKAENKELECFAVSQVSDPVCVALESNDLYNNIVVFTVKRNPPEMHLFQCIGKPGQEVVDDVIAAISGKFPRQQPAPKVVPVPRVPSSHSLEDDRSLGSSLDDLTRPGGGFEDVPVTRNPFNRPFQNSDQMQYNGSDAGGSGVNPKTSKQSQNDGNDVIMLNHCLDDIEGFVASLQQAANAQKELDKRLAMNGGQDPAVDMLRSRSQPPPLQYFVDTLQKFKVAFNLLSKLRSILKDPDAVQLVHMLFTLLKLVADACRDERGVPKVVQMVESPMLTGDACLFLETNLIPPERQLWQSLGPAWTTPGHLWVGDVPPYIPRFKDGWQHPAYAVENTADTVLSNFGRPSMQDRGMMFGSTANANNSSQNMAPTPYGSQFEPQPQGLWQGSSNSQQLPGSNYPVVGQGGPPPGQYQTSQQNPAQGYQQGFGAGLSQEPSRAVPQSAAVVSSSQPGPVLENTPDSDSLTINPSHQRFLNDLKARGALICTVGLSRDATNSKELSVKAGDVVEVIENTKNWWKVKNHLDQAGYVPNTLLSAYSG